MCSIKRRRQSPEWTILSHVSCFIQGEVVGFQVFIHLVRGRCDIRPQQTDRQNDTYALSCVNEDHYTVWQSIRCSHFIWEIDVSCQQSHYHHLLSHSKRSIITHLSNRLVHWRWFNCDEHWQSLVYTATLSLNQEITLMIYQAMWPLAS